MKYVIKKDYNPEKDDTLVEKILFTIAMVLFFAMMYLVSFPLSELLS